MILATVLYEDSMLPGAAGSYPLHDLVMRLVEDAVNGQTWRLRRLVRANPRKGIDKLLQDLRSASLIAGSGQLFLLVDRDRIIEHLNRGTAAGDRLELCADDAAIADFIRERRSDAPERVQAFFLDPNVEGLLAAIQACDPSVLPEQVTAALRKSLNDRDIVFNEVKKASHRVLRDCIAARQPGLRALASAIAAALPADALA